MNEIQHLVERYKAGSSLAELAAVSGRSRSWVWKTLIAAGIELRPRGGSRSGVRMTQEKRQEALRLCQQGKTHKEIAALLGVAKYTVHYWLRREVKQRRGPKVFFNQEGHKLCRGCGRYLPLDRYSASGKKNRNRTRCSECERFKDRARAYGITREEYEARYTRQEQACAICRTKHVSTPARPDLCVDHCHKTGQIRGLLCHTCNLALGLFQDSPELLKNAVTYLEHSHGQA